MSYLEGCTAPMRDENQLHAAVVELVALDDASIKYSTVQNWYPGDENGIGGIYNFVTKRGDCRGARSKISWTQVETGSAITWKYPSCILRGDDSVGEFNSVALTHHRQQADTGTKMIHIGRNTKSKIVSKGISAGRGQNTYRGLVKVEKGAEGARNHTQCDSLLIGKKCGAHTFPYIEVKNPGAIVEHEATTSKISDDQLFYCRARGIGEEDAVSMIVDGFCKQVFKRAADGVRGRGEEAARGFAGRSGRMKQSRCSLLAARARMRAPLRPASRRRYTPEIHGMLTSGKQPVASNVCLRQSDSEIRSCGYADASGRFLIGSGPVRRSPLTADTDKTPLTVLARNRQRALAAEARADRGERRPQRGDRAQLRHGAARAASIRRSARAMRSRRDRSSRASCATTRRIAWRVPRAPAK